MTQSPAEPSPERSGAQRVRIFTVPPERAGQRLDNLLFGQLKGVPKSRVYRLLRTGQVRVNGGRAKPAQRVQAGDQVRLPPVRQGVAESVSFAPDQLAELKQRVIDRDSNYLAVDKPAGLAVHGGTGLRFGLIEMLRAAYPDQTLELVHRIDRGTSGVVLIARHRAALLDAQRQLRQSTVVKRYLCLLLGHLPEQRLEVSAKLLRVGGRDASRVIVDPQGKPALTQFTELEKVRGDTFAEAIIQTGRTHQVRVHAAHIGHPLLGDTQYGGPRRPGLQRPALHCAAMELSGAYPFVAHAPLADDLRALLHDTAR